MSLSSDIARGNMARLAGGKDQLIYRSDWSLAAGLLAQTTDQFIKPRREIRHLLPALEKTTHNRVTDHEKLVLQIYHYSGAFKAITYSRRLSYGTDRLQLSKT